MADNDNEVEKRIGMVSGRSGRWRAGGCAVCTEGRQGDARGSGSERAGRKERAAVLAQQAQERAAELAAQGKQQLSEYVDRGKEYYDRGRTQWAQYVEKGKGLVQEQQSKVAAAIDAGKDAYVNTTTSRIRSWV